MHRAVVRQLFRHAQENVRTAFDQCNPFTALHEQQYELTEPWTHITYHRHAAALDQDFGLFVTVEVQRSGRDAA